MSVTEDQIKAVHDYEQEQKESKIKKKEELEERRIKWFVGKFFSDLHSEYENERLDVYRVFKGTGAWDKIVLERWYYYHAEHYGVDRSRFHEGISGGASSFDKQINEVQFWYIASQVLKKFGAYQAINQETNHCESENPCW